MPGTVSPFRALASLGAAAALAIGLGACGVIEKEPNLIAGKQAFVEKCGSCHVLNRAGTKGVSGPNLDEAFQQALRDGMKRSTIEGVVRKQIDIPAREPQVDPNTQEEAGFMPADLVKGQLADDVSAYVASVAARSGQDTGRLADIGTKAPTEAAQAQNGELDIPADPDGGLVYEFASATAPAGPLTITSPNESSIPHNIALEGGGVNEEGEVVQDGGISEISVDLSAGEYTFYCSVPGHREGGMEGTLTVEG